MSKEAHIWQKYLLYSFLNEEIIFVGQILQVVWCSSAIYAKLRSAQMLRLVKINLRFHQMFILVALLHLTILYVAPAVCCDNVHERSDHYLCGNCLLISEHFCLIPWHKKNKDSNFGVIVTKSLRYPNWKVTNLPWYHLMFNFWNTHTFTCRPGIHTLLT